MKPLISLALISFTGAFLLVGYEVKEAKGEVGEEDSPQPLAPSGSKFGGQQERLWSANPHLEQGTSLLYLAISWRDWWNKRLNTVGYFVAKCPPPHLLERIHSIAILSATIGFVFAIVGVLCYIWSQQAPSVSIFSSACVGVCFLVSLTVMGPFAKAQKQNDWCIPTIIMYLYVPLWE